MQMTFKRLSYCFVLAAGMLWGAENGYNLFQKGLAKERAEADPRAAIKIYEQVVRENAKDHKLAAQALIRLAECYEKLGEAQSRKIYERVLREYGDQKEAVTVARARLGSSAEQRPTATLVWALPKPYYDPSMARISADGRYLSFVDWETGDLGLHDFATGENRNLTQGAGNNYSYYAEESAISPDGRRIAFSWGNDEGWVELRLADLAGKFAPRTIYNNPETTWISVYDWSPDGKLLAVQVTRRDRTNQLGLISVADGSLRVLKSPDWRGASRVFFSPDGKQLGYDLPESDTRQQRDVFVISLDGAAEIRAVADRANDIMMGWSPDGRWLAPASSTPSD